MPTVTINAPTAEDMQRQCRILIHGMRAHVDPRLSSPDGLCEKLHITRQYLNRFMQKGFVPLHVARRMNKAFGDTLAPIDQLSWTLRK